MSDVERRYHESWLGMVQPIEGLVFSVPVLVDAEVMLRTEPARQEQLRAELIEREGRLRVRDLRGFLRRVLAFDDTDLDVEPDPSLSHYVPEGQQTVTPTLAVRARGAGPERRPELLVWQVPDGLDLDAPEALTGPWTYPPQAKLDRLLRAVRCPLGLLTNGEAFRLVYAPHGESTGALTFRVEDLASVGGRPILDAFLSLLSAPRFFDVAPDRTLAALVAESRKRQASVTNALAPQVLAALDLLLQGFQAAEERDGTSALRDAMSTDGAPGEHVYGGLLTAMLRLVFLLYAEDRGLMPTEHPVYAEHLSVLGLFEQLQQDAGLYPDTMARRFGAWPRLLALFRAVYEGVDSGDLQLPPRRGRLFDPNAYPFLEGWSQGGAAPHDVESRSEVRVPSIDDGTVERVLEKLLVLDGQRLSYRALDVEQIGAVYEALMGYRAERLASTAVCLRDSGVWLESERVLTEPPGRREALLVDESALSKKTVGKVADALRAARTEAEVVAALEPLRQDPKRLAPRKAGAIVLQPGAERRRTSSHYTPRSLSAPIVEKTLRPLLATMAASSGGVTSDGILELKVCDPAMGSGAFLVEACRFLGDALVAAWTTEGRLREIERQHGEPLVYARRLVAQRCLYGVDKNPYAVNLAKLSLWLVSLAKDEPFTFVDHALRWGDSLVGLSLDQLRRFHWDDARQADWIVDVVTKDLDEAMVHRQRILELARTHGARTAREKEDLLRDADDAARNARLLGDVLVGAFFAHDKAKAREQERVKRLTAAQAWIERQEPPTDELLEWQRAMHAVAPPFHWPIEFPEVFYAGRPDPLDAGHASRVAWMDAFVGNPPFMGGSSISSNQGGGYLAWLLERPSSHGNADYCAHFFRRCWDLLGAHGTLGLIATNTIAQGDTRATGLQALVRDGGTIYDATRSMMWPGLAAVAISVVHVAKGVAREHVGGAVLETEAVGAISSQLLAGAERRDPTPLWANSGKSFMGTKIYGQGFVLTPDERGALIQNDARNGERIFPYLGGEEVNTSPTQDFERYVISFGEMALEEAARWPDLLAIVREKVKPERDKNNRENYRLKWWQFGEGRPGLRAALRGLQRCLVTGVVSKHLIFSFQPTERIFSHKLCVFPIDDLGRFSALQSRPHAIWTRLLSSTMKEDLNYSASDCFDTFPFPRPEHLAPNSPVDRAGHALYTARADLMRDAQQGLTTTYNQLKDPANTDPRILDLRRLHEAMDRAVLDAYGWTDLSVPPYCPTTPTEQEALAAFENEVIDRLFTLNAERAQEEERLGLGTKKKPPPKKKPPTPEPTNQGGFF